MNTRPRRCSGSSTQPLRSATTSRPPYLSTTADKYKQPTKCDGVILSLDVAIGLVKIGKEASSVMGSSCFLRRHYSPHHHQGKSHLLRGRDVPGSNVIRTRRPMNRIVWTSGYSALMSVMPLSGERVERGQTSSATQCAMQ